MIFARALYRLVKDAAVDSVIHTVDYLNRPEMSTNGFAIHLLVDLKAFRLHKLHMMVAQSSLEALKMLCLGSSS